MKKILVAFSGSYFPDGALEFAFQLNKTQPILLTGVFIPQATYSYLWSAAATLGGPVLPPLYEEVTSEVVEENITKFKSLCELNNIKYKVHRDVYDFVLPELTKESRFADLLILSSEKFYESLSKEETIDRLKDILQATECPVLVVPENFKFPEKNILAYDGSASSVYAIKQFAYLFPELTNNESLLIFSKNEEEAELPYETFIEELGNQHYKNLKLLKLKINPKKYFTTWLNQEKNVILVSGSFGRSSVSQLFRKSFVTEVISEHKLPVFIAHR
ncbi:hypothetical protein [Segetibacter koreensis]|uniref:hypothetical protein n=1 Tax=Segetibacter koreensis TaxID=398037 RepID=UPI00037DF362|nr:hypothetical protein [Segetibacter koreensis]